MSAQTKYHRDTEEHPMPAGVALAILFAAAAIGIGACYLLVRIFQ
jgi:hypothetical protein